MQHFELSSGDRVPALGLGTWRSAPDEVGRAVREALRLGYRHLDCAAIYGNEPEIGAVLREAFEAGDVKREELWITSKLWNDSHEADRVRPALEKTLADLQLEALDLYLVHWPVALKAGVDLPDSGDDFLRPEQAPLSATWRALEACVRDGLCRNIGVSNFSVKKTAQIVDGASIRPVMNQVELHPYLQQDELVGWCRAQGILVTAYSPLGSEGRRAGDPARPLADPVIERIAEAHDATAAQVLIGWAMQRGTLVIPKSVRPERLKENLAAAELTLTDDDMARIADLDRGHRFVDGSFWAPEGSPYSVAWLWDE